MKLAVLLSTDEPETNWNALRLANFARKQGDDVSVFLVGKGVDYERGSCAKFDAKGQAEDLLRAGGRLLACGTCLKSRERGGTELCPVSTMKDLYELVRDSDRVVSF
ncbi:MAG: hypothetical protein FD126_352 [Elusimicrobia bacterium]|nr:MAG: hypothetical protein FD126_352 [Elusimicrobiota bacterium]